MAARLTGPVTGVLRAPPPLDTPLTLDPDEGVVRLRDGAGALLAEASAADAASLPAVPPAPSFAAAAAAGRRFIGLTRPFHPICVTCAANLAEGVGLRVFTGQVEGAPDGLVAGTWSLNGAFADKDGLASLEVVWAAIDCPGSFAWVAKGGGGGVLGTMSCEVIRRPAVGEPCVILAWPIEARGRKSIAGVALFDAEGELMARGRQIWISWAQRAEAEPAR